MPNLNKVQLMGNLTRDPEVKYTPKGTAVCSVSLAINRHWKDDSGQKQEETTFVDIECWGRQAEIVGEYCSKGKPVFFEGRLKLESWEDKESGQKRSRMKVVAENLQLLGSGGGEGGSRPERPAQKQASRASAPADSAGDDGDDIPF